MLVGPAGGPEPSALKVSVKNGTPSRVIENWSMLTTMAWLLPATASAAVISPAARFLSFMFPPSDRVAT
jgi:hypothetical protein